MESISNRFAFSCNQFLQRCPLFSATGHYFLTSNPRFRMTLSSSAPQHTPSQFVTDDEGLKWRLCAGAAVLNSKNELLIGERIGKPGSWQTPQGGVDGGDKPESVTDAAIRELYEEIGLEHGRHVLLEDTDGGTSSIKCRYKTGGTGSWLERAGFAGQELNWTLFRCADVSLERNPQLVCTLSGLNGEKPEFADVRWKKLDWVVENVWSKKSRPYEVLREACIPIMKRWDERCCKLDLSGRWSRDSDRCVGVVEGLVARGLTEESALARATEPYIQDWKRHATDREWIVTTLDASGNESRRVLHYPLGEFQEAYEGTSTLFGGTNGGIIWRCCFYMAEGDSDDGIAHVTVSDTPRGKEESVRYLKSGDLILRRTFVHSWRTGRVVS
ncbi:hypothetical protein ACHAWF_005305, partial [Thalassiosira exigua]